MFLGVPQELSSAAGGSLMGDASSFYAQRVEQALWDEVGEITAHDAMFDIRTFADETSTAFLKLQRAFAAQDGRCGPQGAGDSAPGAGPPSDRGVPARRVAAT